MATIFSKIVAGEIPSYKVAENEQFYAFLDINPLAKGHTLVIPKREVDYFFDLTDEEIGAMQIFAKKVAEGIKRAFPCIKVGQAVLGLEVPHAHIHLVPMQSERDMLFTNPKLKLTPEEFKEIADKIKSEIARQAISLFTIKPKQPSLSLVCTPILPIVVMQGENIINNSIIIHVCTLVLFYITLAII